MLIPTASHVPISQGVTMTVHHNNELGVAAHAPEEPESAIATAHRAAGAGKVSCAVEKLPVLVKLRRDVSVETAYVRAWEC
jgi:hypothetical protein